MSGKEIILKADATAGLKVREGETVAKGEQVGTRAAGAVVSPVTGMVEKITFNSDRHEFVIVIRSE